MIRVLCQRPIRVWISSISPLSLDCFKGFQKEKLRLNPLYWSILDDKDHVLLSHCNPIVIPIESIEAQPVVHIKAHLHHGPQRNELKNWAMRFSEQICQWASRVTWVGAFIDEHYWTLLNTYVPIFLEKHLWPPEKPGQISWVFAARIGTWWSQLTQMMPFGNRAWPGNPRSIEVLNGAMA